MFLHFLNGSSTLNYPILFQKPRNYGFFRVKFYKLFCCMVLYSSEKYGIIYTYETQLR